MQKAGHLQPLPGFPGPPLPVSLGCETKSGPLDPQQKAASLSGRTTPGLVMSGCFVCPQRQRGFNLSLEENSLGAKGICFIWKIPKSHK